jgi:hypothetical protein
VLFYSDTATARTRMKGILAALSLSFHGDDTNPSAAPFRVLRMLDAEAASTLVEFHATENHPTGVYRVGYTAQAVGNDTWVYNRRLSAGPGTHWQPEAAARGNPTRVTVTGAVSSESRPSRNLLQVHHHDRGYTRQLGHDMAFRHLFDHAQGRILEASGSGVAGLGSLPITKGVAADLTATEIMTLRLVGVRHAVFNSPQRQRKSLGTGPEGKSARAISEVLGHVQGLLQRQGQLAGVGGVTASLLKAVVEGAAQGTQRGWVAWGYQGLTLAAHTARFLSAPPPGARHSVTRPLPSRAPSQQWAMAGHVLNGVRACFAAIPRADRTDDAFRNDSMACVDLYVKVSRLSQRAGYHVVW